MFSVSFILFGGAFSLQLSLTTYLMTSTDDLRDFLLKFLSGIVLVIPYSQILT